MKKRSCISVIFLLLYTAPCKTMLSFGNLFKKEPIYHEQKRSLASMFFEHFVTLTQVSVLSRYEKENALIEMINIYIPEQIPITAKDDEGQTLLHHAAKHCFTRVIQHLLSKKINLNALNSESQTALHVLAMNRTNDIVDIPHTLNQEELRAISFLIADSETQSFAIKKTRGYCKDQDLCKLILKRELLLKHKKLIDEYRCYESSIRADTAKLLVQHGTLVDIRDIRNFTARDYAFQNNYHTLAYDLLVFETDQMMKVQEDFFNRSPSGSPEDPKSNLAI